MIMQKKLKDRKISSMTFSSHELFFGKFVIDTILSKQFGRHNHYIFYVHNLIDIIAHILFVHTIW
jgi:hypothetical protein